MLKNRVLSFFLFSLYILCGCRQEEKARGGQEEEATIDTVLSAPFTTSPGDDDRAAFRLRVHLLSQFISCFNGKEAPPGMSLPPEPAGEEYRRQALRRLMAPEFLEGPDSSRAEAFLARASQQPFELSLTEAGAFACAAYQAAYEGKPAEALLSLQTETDSLGGQRWVIVGVNASFLDPFLPLQPPESYLSPLDHELGFLRLGQQLQERQSLQGLAHESLLPDRVNIFLGLLQKGALEIQDQKGFYFMFLQAPGWGVRVENLNRFTPNSGWLITGAFPMSGEEKYAFLQQELGISSPQILRPYVVAPTSLRTAAEVSPDSVRGAARQLARHMESLFNTVEGQPPNGSGALDSLLGLFSYPQVKVVHNIGEGSNPRVELYSHLSALTGLMEEGRLKLKYEVMPDAEVRTVQRAGRHYGLVEARRSVQLGTQPAVQFSETVVISLEDMKIDGIYDTGSLYQQLGL